MNFAGSSRWITKPWHLLVIAALVVGIGSGVGLPSTAQGMAQSAIGGHLTTSGVSGLPAAMPLSSVLNQHGTLNLTAGFQESTDGGGRKIVRGSDEPPPVSLLPGDERWADWFGQPGVNAGVLAVAADAAGNVYVGGEFTEAGGASANRIAKWNGMGWSALGAGLDGTVRALAVDGSGNVYAGGDFTTAGGVAANRIAKWDGSTWSAVGSGVNNSVYALAIQPSSERSRYLWVGGDFTAAGDKPSYFIARWDIFTKVFVPLAMKSYAGGW